MKSTKRRVLAGLAALAMLAAACSGSGSSGTGASATGGETMTGGETATDTEAATPDEPPMGGTLTYNAATLGPSLHPTGVSQLSGAGQSGYIFAAIYDMLVVPTNEGYDPRLAESLESSDAVHWTMKLRSDVEFSDGTPFDAEAVKYNWDLNREEGTTGFSAMQSVEDLVVTDDLTLDITLIAPNGQFPRLVANNLNAVGSPTAMEADPEGFANTPVGAGPFKVESFVPDGQLDLVRNENFWDAPRPYLDNLIFRPVVDSDQAFAAITTGDADAMFVLTPDIIAKAQEQNYEVDSWEPTVGSVWMFNTSIAPFDDVRVRRALSMGMDAQGHSDTLDRGLTEVPTTLFTEESPFHNPDIKLPEYNPEEAQRLLTEVAEEQGGPVEFSFYGAPGPWQLIMEYFQAQLSTYDDLEVGVDVGDRTTIIADIFSGKFQAGNWSVNTMDPDPELYQAFHSGSYNIPQHQNEELDAALQIGHESLDFDERKAAYDTVQQIISDEAYGFFFGRKFYSSVWNPERVGGIDVVGTGTPVFYDAYVVE